MSVVTPPLRTRTWRPIMRGKLALVFDTETTGLPRHPSTPLNRQPEIIEYGGILYDLAKKQVVSELSMLIKPRGEVSAEITRITGILPAHLKDSPAFGDESVLTPIQAQFALADILVAHNLPFDEGMLRFELERIGGDTEANWPWPEERMCTVQEHYQEWGRRPRLIHLYEHYMQKPLEQTHRALDDCRALLEVCLAGRLFD